ncbi:MAG TPA: polysaccharide biosynthesis/export family protein [Polyangiaceae bacterium]|nr:polysaccharide biosynthesis/export family protein [Polyangiaceae bacterium]
MLRSLLALVLGLVLLLPSTGCGPRTDNSRIKLAPPVENTTVGAGDVFTLEIVGEKDLPTEFQIASDGNVDLPYVHRLHVEGLEPQEISALVRKTLMEMKVLSDPSVIVRVREYNSKHVTVLGQVSKPGSFPFSAGITLIQAISMAGGFNAVAKHDSVTLKRKTKDDVQTVVVSVDAITEGGSPDILLQAGDQIYVPERVF